MRKNRIITKKNRTIEVKKSTMMIISKILGKIDNKIDKEIVIKEMKIKKASSREVIDVEAEATGTKQIRWIHNQILENTI